QAEDGIRDFHVTGVQTCALPISYTERLNGKGKSYLARVNRDDRLKVCPKAELIALTTDRQKLLDTIKDFKADGVTAGGIAAQWEIGRASCRERGQMWRDGVGVTK